MKPKEQITTASLTSHFQELMEIYNVLGWREYVGPILHGNGRRTKNPKAGFPDFAGLTKRGIFWGAEIKGPGDTMSPKQIEWHSRLEASEGLLAVIRSYEDTTDFIAKILRN